MLKKNRKTGNGLRLATEKLQRLFWPEVCPFCGKASAEGICQRCRKKLEKVRIKEPLCMKCGKPVRFFRQEYCHDCAHTYHYYDRGRALWRHTVPVSQSIYRFKFHNQRVFARYYAEEAENRMKNVIGMWKPELILPIPLHVMRKRKRGYNQAELFAAELGKVFGIPMEAEILVRVRNTKWQKKLSSHARKQNLMEAFQITDEEKAKQIQHKTLLLVDDIYTTGSTIDAAAKTLNNAGAEKVYYLTISIGQGY